jgi:acyl-coenzyme A synthetase/AMP-(fatty) acid ligase
MCFLGRNDSQIKIHGARIELGDVEAALRKSACTALAAAVGWPRSKTGTEGIIAFIDKPGADVAAILADLKHRLPNVMVPRQVRLLQQVPLNANGKVDRNALLRLLESETPARTAPRVQSASGNS